MVVRQLNALEPKMIVYSAACSSDLTATSNEATTVGGWVYVVV